MQRIRTIVSSSKLWKTSSLKANPWKFTPVYYLTTVNDSLQTQTPNSSAVYARSTASSGVQQYLRNPVKKELKTSLLLFLKHYNAQKSQVRSDDKSLTTDQAVAEDGKIDAESLANMLRTLRDVQDRSLVNRVIPGFVFSPLSHMIKNEPTNIALEPKHITTAAKVLQEMSMGGALFDLYGYVLALSAMEKMDVLEPFLVVMLKFCFSHKKYHPKCIEIYRRHIYPSAFLAEHSGSVIAASYDGKKLQSNAIIDSAYLATLSKLALYPAFADLVMKEIKLFRAFYESQGNSQQRMSKQLLCQFITIYGNLKRLDLAEELYAKYQSTLAPQATTSAEKYSEDVSVDIAMYRATIRCRDQDPEKFQAILNAFTHNYINTDSAVYANNTYLADKILDMCLRVNEFQIALQFVEKYLTRSETQQRKGGKQLVIDIMLATQFQSVLNHYRFDNSSNQNDQSTTNTSASGASAGATALREEKELERIHHLQQILFHKFDSIVFHSKSMRELTYQSYRMLLFRFLEGISIPMLAAGRFDVILNEVLPSAGSASSAHYAANDRANAHHGSVHNLTKEDVMDLFAAISKKLHHFNKIAHGGHQKKKKLLSNESIVLLERLDHYSSILSPSSKAVASPAGAKSKCFAAVFSHVLVLLLQNEEFYHVAHLLETKRQFVELFLEIEGDASNQRYKHVNRHARDHKARLLRLLIRTLDHPMYYSEDFPSGQDAEDVAAEDVAAEDVAIEAVAAEDVAIEAVAAEDVAIEAVAAEDVAAEAVSEKSKKHFLPAEEIERRLAIFEKAILLLNQYGISFTERDISAARKVQLQYSLNGV